MGRKFTSQALATHNIARQWLSNTSDLLLRSYGRTEHIDEEIDGLLGMLRHIRPADLTIRGDVPALLSALPHPYSGS